MLPVFQCRNESREVKQLSKATQNQCVDSQGHVCGHSPSKHGPPLSSHTPAPGPKHMQGLGYYMPSPFCLLTRLSCCASWPSAKSLLSVTACRVRSLSAVSQGTPQHSEQHPFSSPAWMSALALAMHPCCVQCSKPGQGDKCMHVLTSTHMCTHMHTQSLLLQVLQKRYWPSQHLLYNYQGPRKAAPGEGGWPHLEAGITSCPR